MQRSAHADPRLDRDAVFRALGDPTRRAILERLRNHERGVNELCAPFAMSQPAISQHLKVLSDAGLVSATRNGRERIYRLRPAPLRDAYGWLGDFEQFWAAKLDGLGAYLDAQADEPDEPDASDAPVAAPKRRASARRKPASKVGARR